LVDKVIGKELFGRREFLSASRSKRAGNRA